MQEEEYSQNKFRLSLTRDSLDITIPKAVIKRIVGLNLRENGLMVLPDVISQLTNLEELNISSNKLLVGEEREKALNVLGFLSYLRILDLGYNHGERFSWDDDLRILLNIVNKLTNLEMLNLDRNDLTSLPNLSKLSCLRELNLAWNRLSEGGDNALRVSSPLQNLRILKFGYNGLTILPDLSKLFRLEELDLGWNKLNEGGDNALRALSSLQNLRILNLCYNGLKTLPDVISKLSSLEKLCLSGNKLWYGREKARKLKRLKVLGSLENLRSIDLEWNNLWEDEVDTLRSALPQAEIIV